MPFAIENSVLNKGLNFTMTKWIPYLDLIAFVKEAASKIPYAQADELRWKVSQALEKWKPPKPNISKGEWLAVKSLQGNKNINLPADKNNVTVVMDKVEFLIGNGSYSKVKMDTTLKTERKLSQVLG